MLRLLLFTSILIPFVVAYSTGPPVSRCGSMIPGHGFSGQTTASPYNVVTTATGGYTPGKEYTITIQKASSASPDFKGFMCQVRAADGSSTTARGTFEGFNTGKAQNLGCTTSKGAVTHKNGNDVSSFSATWKAPSPGAGQLKALCTVVQVKSTFWVQVGSAAFSELSSPTTQAVTTNPQAATTKASKPSANTVTMAGTKQSATTTANQQQSTAATTKPLPNTVTMAGTTKQSATTTAKQQSTANVTDKVDNPMTATTAPPPTDGENQLTLSKTAWITITVILAVVLC